MSDQDDKAVDLPKRPPSGDAVAKLLRRIDGELSPALKILVRLLEGPMDAGQEAERIAGEEQLLAVCRDCLHAIERLSQDGSPLFQADIPLKRERLNPSAELAGWQAQLDALCQPGGCTVALKRPPIGSDAPEGDRRFIESDREAIALLLAEMARGLAADLEPGILTLALDFDQEGQRLLLTRLGGTTGEMPWSGALFGRSSAFSASRDLARQLGGDLGFWGEARSGAAAWVDLPGTISRSVPEEIAGTPEWAEGKAGDGLVLDEQVLERLKAETSAAVLEDLLVNFSGDLIKRSAALSDALTRHDFEAMVHQTHTLASSAATFGAIPLRDITKAAEMALKAGNIRDGEARVAGIADLADTTWRAIQAYRSKSPP
ncbi:MAG: Hpt domain-containing protein [Rhodospirillales bacterium]